MWGIHTHPIRGCVYVRYVYLVNIYNTHESK
nr:MAG TPA: hypothetical protein [Caudoviricetes sp.]